jgi:dGTPase
MDFQSSLLVGNLLSKDLFNYFLSNPSQMSESYQIKSTKDLARSVADYLAGMTDRYAIKTHKEVI